MRSISWTGCASRCAVAFLRDRCSFDIEPGVECPYTRTSNGGSACGDEWSTGGWRSGLWC